MSLFPFPKPVGYETLRTMSGVGLSQVIGGLMDAIEGGRSFATAARPSAVQTPGTMIYDTTLRIPLWSDGAAWRDATGTVR